MARKTQFQGLGTAYKDAKNTQDDSVANLTEAQGVNLPPTGEPPPDYNSQMPWVYGSQPRQPHRAAFRMQSLCTLPGHAPFRAARHLTCSVLSGVVLRRLLSSGNIVNWGEELGLYREHEDRKTTPAEALLARDKVSTRDPAPRVSQSGLGLRCCCASA